MDELLAKRLLENNFLDRLDNTQDRVSLLEKLSASIATQLRDKYAFEARLTLETGVYLSTTDQLAKTVLYLTKYNGNQISLYDGVSSWSNIPLNLDVSIKITDAQTGTTTNGNKIISGLTDTSQLVVGMKISGTNVGVASVIATIDSSTQITGTVNSTGTASNTITFKCPADTVYDVFCYSNIGVPKLELVAGVVTRATQDGIIVKTGFTTRRWAGTICTTATDGELEWSTKEKSISNLNQLFTSLSAKDTTDNWTYTTATWRSSNNSTVVGVARVKFVIGLPLHSIVARIGGYTWNNTPCFVAHGVGVDVTNANSAQIFGGFVDANGSQHSAYYSGIVATGSHFLQKLELSLATGTSTWYGDGGNIYTQSGMIVDLWA